MELLVGYILSGGVVLSMLCLVTGIAWRWIATGSPGLDYQIKGMNLAGFCLQVFRQAAAGHFEAHLFVNLGIALLLLTPYIRVIASVVYFAFVERNIKYTFFTAIVCAVLTYSLLLR
jgi:uncharacterized membrane protein